MVELRQVGMPLDVRPLVEPERTALVELLSGLDDAGWAAPTVCPGWTVHDVATHLLHDDLRRLSRHRDGYPGPGPAPGEDLPAFLDRVNDAWVGQARFLSPPLLVDLLVHTGRQVADLWRGLDPDDAASSVWWAGLDPAPVWLDLAREYTECWTHQQQIREAVDRPGLTEPRFLDPVVDTFLRALPHVYRDLRRPEGTAVRVVVGGRPWSLVSTGDGWRLGVARAAAATVSTDPDTLWRLATGNVTPARAAPLVRRDGDPELSGRFLRLVSIVRRPPD